MAKQLTCLSIATLSLILFASLTSGAGVQAEPEGTGGDQDVYALLEAMGSKTSAVQVIDALSQSFSQTNPDIPKTFWAEIKKSITSDDFLKLLVPVFRKHLSSEDIKAMLAFYRSPAGKRVSQAMPDITRELMPVSQAWGAQIAQRIAAEAKKRGYKMKI